VSHLLKYNKKSLKGTVYRPLILYIYADFKIFFKGPQAPVLETAKNVFERLNNSIRGITESSNKDLNIFLSCFLINIFCFHKGKGCRANSVKLYTK
jgi:hypothetical protein